MRLQTDASLMTGFLLPWPRSPLFSSLLAMLGGAAASLALPPVGLVPMVLLLVVPILLLGRAACLGHAICIGLGGGFGWFFASLFWVGQALITGGPQFFWMLPFATAGLPLLLGLFWAGGFGLAWKFGYNPQRRLLLLPPVLMLVEYGRGLVLTGFPWNSPGMVALADLRLANAAAWTGLWGLGLVVVSALAGFGLVLITGVLQRNWRSGVLLLPLLLAWLGGSWHLQTPPQAGAADGLVIRLVQPAIPQTEKWQRDRRDAHLGVLLQLSTQTTAKRPDLVIWPETAFAGLLGRDAATLSALGRRVAETAGPLLTGILHAETEPQRRPRFFNSMVLLDEAGRPVSRYDKRHLVPFGEYVPLRSLLGFVPALTGMGGFETGEAAGVMLFSHQGEQLPLAGLICYEIIFPAAVRGRLAEGAVLLINITNDGWFGTSIGPGQHLAHARLRSIELGRPLVRAANTGISAGFDSHGRLLGALPLGQAGKLDITPGGVVSTFYARNGDWPLLLLMAGWVMLTIGWPRQR